MKHVVIGFTLAMLLIPVTWAGQVATENYDITERQMLLEFGAAMSGVDIGPEEACEGPAVCLQVGGSGSCSYKCLGPAAGNYSFTGCNGQTKLAFCLFQGGPDNCGGRCIPNPF